jgi:hypothetical protein
VKRLIGKIILVSVLSVIPLLAYNIILDPFSVIRKDFKSMWVCPNERFVKTDHVLRNPTKYNSFLFGSSRVSQIPVEILSSATGDRYYNMAIASGVVAENLTILKLFLKHGVTVKNVIIGIDYFSFQMLPLDMVRNIMYPDTAEEKLKFYFTYLTLPPDSGMLYEIKFDGKDTAYDLLGTGGYDFIKKERNLTLHPDEHEAKFKFPVFTLCRNRMDKTLEELREIVELCKKNNIRLTIFLNPGYASSYVCDDIVFMNTARERLAGLTDFWDFSTVNSINENCFSFIDIIHYRKKIGAMVLQRMFNLKGAVPADFGALVTRADAAGYVEKARRDHQADKKRLKPECLPCVK